MWKTGTEKNFIPLIRGRTWAHQNHPNMSQDIFSFLMKADSSASDYVKFQDGDKRHLRIVGKPIAGYELFCDGKPVRWREDEPRPEHAISDERPKKFVAATVFEYDHDNQAGHIKIWSFTQRSIIDQMFMLFKEEHWTAFELVVVRAGKGLDTKYNVTGIKSPIEENLLAFAAEASKYIKLENMYEGESPFIDDLPELSVKPSKAKSDDLPF